MALREAVPVLLFMFVPFFPGIAWSAIAAPAAAMYADGVIPDEGARACNWQKSMIGSLIKQAKGRVTAFDENGSGPRGFELSLDITRLKLKASTKSSEYSAVARADVRFDGKLVGTRNFSADESFDKGQSGCDALDSLGASLAGDAADWVATMRFPECGPDCDGIHPDETIVVGPEVIASNADAINDTVRKDCDWPAAMVTKVVSGFNKSEAPPRAKLEKRVDIERHARRRLVLYADDVHAVGGGGLSGPKWMSMRGELRDGTLLVASFSSHSTSGRGLTTCRSVESLSEDTVDKIIEWLQNPVLGAELR